MSSNNATIQDNKKVSQLEEQPSISIVDSQNENDPVADLIRNKLEEELDHSTEHPISENDSNSSSNLETIPMNEEVSSTPSLAQEPLQQEDSGYYYVNVMEPIVRKKASDYMESLGMCQCNRCLVDTMALALTNLPAKYVVVRDDNISPLLNYYSNKLEGEVTIEVIKACMLVKEHPHHD